MGTVDAVVGLLTVWTTISTLFVGAWHTHIGRRRVGYAVAEPRSHVQIVVGARLAPVISLDAHRRRSA